MRIDDVEYDFRQSSEYDEALERYKAQLFICKECGGHFTDRDDFSYDVCLECQDAVTSVEAGH